MKNLKNVMSIITLTLVLMVSINVSAQEKKTEPIKSGPIVLDHGNSTIPMLNEFSKDFPSQYKNLNLNYIQDSKGNLVKSSGALSNLEFFTIPVMENSRTVGRIFYNNGNITYTDLTNYKKEINLTQYQASKSKVSFTATTSFDAKSNMYKVNTAAQKIPWCEISCTLGAMAIAASDGPVPLMDILAVTYQVACLLDC